MMHRHGVHQSVMATTKIKQVHEAPTQAIGKPAVSLEYSDEIARRSRGDGEEVVMYDEEKRHAARLAFLSHFPAEESSCRLHGPR